MWLKNNDGTRYDDTEYAYNGNNGMITFRIELDNYYKLSKLAHTNGIMTLDIGTMINLVIKNYPDDLQIK